MAVTNLKLTTRPLSFETIIHWTIRSPRGNALLRLLSTRTTPKFAFSPTMPNEFTLLLERLPLTQTQIVYWIYRFELAMVARLEC
jgi:hypothetical protein